MPLADAGHAILTPIRPPFLFGTQWLVKGHCMCNYTLQVSRLLQPSTLDRYVRVQLGVELGPGVSALVYHYSEAPKGRSLPT